MTSYEPIPNYNGKVHDPMAAQKVFAEARNQYAPSIIDVPSKQNNTSMTYRTQPTKRTTQPIVQGTSVLGVKYNGGVMLCADTLGSYGGLARFKDFHRIKKVTSESMMAAGGDLSDFQYIEKTLEKLVVADECHNDAHRKSPRELWSYMHRIMYNRRSKGDPLWNQLVIAGYRDSQPFLGFVDLYGKAYEENVIATGYGNYIALPLLRNEWSKEITEQQATALLRNAMRVLQYRECRTINKVQFAKVDATGITISQPQPIQLNWDIAHSTSH